MTTANGTVSGSWGTMEIDLTTGNVLSLTGEPRKYEPGERGYRDIVRIDLDEWRKAFPGEEFKAVDVLDVGAWFRDGTYSGPELQWRAENAARVAADNADPDKGAEIAFILPDGSERFEMCFSENDLYAFAQMHKARTFRTV